MFQKLKNKIKKSWQKFKKFYKKKYKENKVLTIVLTIVISIIVIPPLVYLAFYMAICFVMLLFTIGLVWFIFSSSFGGKNKSSSSKSKKSSGNIYYGIRDTYNEEDVFAIIQEYPDLGIYNWHEFAEALDRSKYNSKLEIKQIEKTFVYIFPRNDRPRMNLHLLRDDTMDIGGGLFEKGAEHFTRTELNSGSICVIYDGKRLFSKDL